MVIVRSSPSGVWFGRLVVVSGNTVKLADARRVWSWTGAASCSGLAVTGPLSGKIAAPVKVTVFEVCEIIEASDAACAAFGAIEPWTAR